MSRPLYVLFVLATLLSSSVLAFEGGPLDHVPFVADFVNAPVAAPSAPVPLSPTFSYSVTVGGVTIVTIDQNTPNGFAYGGDWPCNMMGNVNLADSRVTFANGCWYEVTVRYGYHATVRDPETGLPIEYVEFTHNLEPFDVTPGFDGSGFVQVTGPSASVIDAYVITFELHCPCTPEPCETVTLVGYAIGNVTGC